MKAPRDVWRSSRAEDGIRTRDSHPARWCFRLGGWPHSPVVCSVHSSSTSSTQLAPVVVRSASGWSLRIEMTEVDWPSPRRHSGFGDVRTRVAQSKPVISPRSVPRQGRGRRYQGGELGRQERCHFRGQSGDLVLFALDRNAQLCPVAAEAAECPGALSIPGGSKRSEFQCALTRHRRRRRSERRSCRGRRHHHLLGEYPMLLAAAVARLEKAPEPEEEA